MKISYFMHFLWTIIKYIHIACITYFKKLLVSFKAFSIFVIVLHVSIIADA